MSNNVTLKPCPFCGGDDVKTFGPYGWYRHWGISHSCRSFYNGAQELAQGFHSKTEAVTAWNTRAEQSVPNSVVEAFRRVTSHIERYEGQTTFTIADWQLEELDRLTNLQQSGQTEAELLRGVLESIQRHAACPVGHPEALEFIAEEARQALAKSESEYDRLKAQKDDILSKRHDADANKAGGLWYRRWRAAQEEIARLSATQGEGA